MQWHVITAEYPPQLGGVSDYTFQIVHALVEAGDQVHVWMPGAKSYAPAQQPVRDIHPLPTGFGWRWLRELDRGLRSYSAPRHLLIQYVPHGYGWKSMNLAFCLWIFLQRNHNVTVMFHEVAYPFRPGQLWRHTLLAVVHRIMAWLILRSARHSFTSADQYLSLLQRLGSSQASIRILRLCSNVPLDKYSNGASGKRQDIRRAPVVGVFSSFGREICELLEPAIACILQNSQSAIVLIGPAELFVQTLLQRYPMCADRMTTTGRLHVSEVGSHIRRCNVLLQLYPDGASAAHGTLIAALASGTPVVTTRGPLTDQFFIESKAVLLSPNAPESIQSSIDSLLANPAAAEALGNRARRLYEDYFRAEVIASKLQQTVLSEAATRPSSEESATQPDR